MKAYNFHTLKRAAYRPHVLVYILTPTMKCDIFLSVSGTQIERSFPVIDNNTRVKLLLDTVGKPLVYKAEHILNMQAPRSYYILILPEGEESTSDSVICSAVMTADTVFEFFTECMDSFLQDQVRTTRIHRSNVCQQESRIH